VDEGMADRRGLRIALAAAVLLVVVGGLLVTRGGGVRVAPDFAVPDLHGNTVRLSGLRGKVVLLNLWATWCPPCREEMPSMESVWGRLRDRGLVLLAVSEDEEAARVAPFVTEMKLSFPVLLDPRHEVGDRYGVWGYPETFVIDRNGNVVERVIGPRQWDAPAELAKLEALLAAPGGGADARPASVRSFGLAEGPPEG
jgi:peroxiredoxin